MAQPLPRLWLLFGSRNPEIPVIDRCPPQPQTRFPILLALNKADLADAPRHIARVRAAQPWEPAVAVSAATERSVGQCGAVCVGDEPRHKDGHEILQIQTSFVGSQYGPFVWFW